MPSTTTTFGATIVPAPNNPHNSNYIPEPIPTSPALTPAVSRDGSLADYYNRPAPIQSPFYEHPPASHETIPKLKANLAVFEKDIESGNVTPLSPYDAENPFGKNLNVEKNMECKMWPSKQTLKEKRKADRKLKRDRKGMASCAPVFNWWSRLTKRQRLLVQVGVALFIIGVAVAIGVGISLAVKGNYYVADGRTSQVGSP